MQSKVTLVNSNQNWSQKRRYKINNVVSYLGSIYQNSTGINTDPSLLTDWVTVNKVNNEVQTYTEILTENKQTFTLPLGAKVEQVMQNEALLINTTNVLYPKRYTFVDNVVTITSPTTVTNNRITILYR